MILEDGHNVTNAYLDETQFRSPILVENAAGLGLVVPPSSFTADDVEKHVGKLIIIFCFIIADFCYFRRRPLR